MRRGRGFAADERGLVPLLLVLILGAAAVIGVGIALLGGSDTALRQQSASSERLKQIEKLLRVHTFQNGRLPCPANPDGDGGERATCTGIDNAGIVPWRTLGLTREKSRDDFGRMISYVIDPNLANGDICAGAPAALAGGLGVQPSGGPRLFALISHGPNGFGGWLAAGARMQSPASAAERDNCANVTSSSALEACADPDNGSVTAGPFNADPGSPTLFDDDILLAKSSDYDPVCAALAASGVTGAQISFADIRGTAPAGETGGLHPGDPFRGTADTGTSSAPRVIIGEDGDPTLVRIGDTDDDSGSSCIFIKNHLSLRQGMTNKVLRAYLQFSFREDGGNEEDEAVRGEGIVLAFVPRKVDSGPASYNDALAMCGGSGARMGYQFDTGNNFPDSNKFGVEIDTSFTTSISGDTVSDAPNNHIAINRNQVLHNNAAGPKCVASAPGSLAAPPAGCRPRSSALEDRDWLEQGQSKFHQLRVEVYANGRAVLPDDCGLSEVAVLAWIFENGAECTDGCNNLSSNYANTGTPATAMIRHCLPVPHDKVLVGITTGYLDKSSGPVLRNFGITEATQ